MDTGEYWWIVAIGTAIGALLAPIIGYFRRRNGNGASLSGAAMVDSSIGHGIARNIERLADTIERIERQMKSTADAEEKAREIAAAVAAERYKWEREHSDGDKNG